MKKQEIKNRINEIKNELQELEDKLTKPDRWEPKGGFYYIDNQLNTYSQSMKSTYNDTGMQHTCGINANKHAKAIKRFNWMYQLALELNDGWEPDWGDDSAKCYIYYNHHNKKYLLDTWYAFDYFVPIFKDRITANKAIEIIENWRLDD